MHLSHELIGNRRKYRVHWYQDSKQSVKSSSVLANWALIPTDPNDHSIQQKLFAVFVRLLLLIPVLLEGEIFVFELNRKKSLDQDFTFDNNFCNCRRIVSVFESRCLFNTFAVKCPTLFHHTFITANKRSANPDFVLEGRATVHVEIIWQIYFSLCKTFSLETELVNFLFLVSKQLNLFESIQI